MDFSNACRILEVQSPFTRQTLTRAYYREALRYHPDKNKEEGAEDKFKEVHSAYDYLKLYLEIEHEVGVPHSGEVYEIFLYRLFQYFFRDPVEEGLFVALYGQIRGGCIDLAVRTFELLDRKTAIEIANFCTAYKDVLGIDNTVIEKFKSSIMERLQTIQQYVLNPTLENLLQKDIFCLEVDGQKLGVPLWHEEVTFDGSDNCLIVANLLQLPENVAIDHNNDLHVMIRASASDAIIDQSIRIPLGGKVFELSTTELYLRGQQTTRLRGKGVPRINPQDILDITQIGDIIVHLELY